MTTPIRVVVVDDTPDLRLLLRMALGTEDDIEVVGEAGDGREAIAETERTLPDVVLMDLSMPVMDGLEALPLVRAASPQTRVVVLSGFEATSMAPSAQAAGASAYLQKGMAPDAIVAAVRGVARPGAPPPVRPAGPAVAPAPDPQVARLREAIAATAHEMRNPVSAIVGIAQTLSARGGRLSPQEQAGLLEAVERQARVLDRLTADLLSASHVERGVLEVEPEDVLLLPVLSATVAEHGGAWASVDCPPELAARVDPVRLDQMVGNLVSNAQKYGAPPVAVSAVERDGFVVVEVADRGPGIAPDFEPMLFEQYARAAGTRRPGSGIGLFLVRSLAHAHGGQAWYRPHPKGGAVFGFSLPLAPPP